MLAVPCVPAAWEVMAAFCPQTARSATDPERKLEFCGTAFLVAGGSKSSSVVVGHVVGHKSNTIAEAEAARAASCLRWQRISSASLLGVSQKHSRRVTVRTLCLQVDFVGPLTHDAGGETR